MNNPEHNSGNAERRARPDRRSKKLPVFSKYWWTGRRSHMRRQEDQLQSYRVDRHSPKTFYAIIFIVLLSILDGMLTLYLVEHGAKEINPLLAYFLERGPLPFFGVKYFLTCTCIVFVLLNKDIYLFGTKMRTKVLLIVFIIPFLLVVIWELYLIFYII